MNNPTETTAPSVHVDELDHSYAREWAISYVTNTTERTIMPKSLNMARCYLDSLTHQAELERHVERLKSMRTGLGNTIEDLRKSYARLFKLEMCANCDSCPELARDSFGYIIHCPGCYDGISEFGPGPQARDDDQQKCIDTWNEDQRDFAADRHADECQAVIDREECQAVIDREDRT